MATKEDVLEQIVEEYLIHCGYFVRHNIKFRPRKDHPLFDANKDSNHSDIDVLGFNPLRTGAERIYAVSCKSWQNGFAPSSWLKDLSGKGRRKVGSKEPWKHFRELTNAKWSEAFRDIIKKETGEKQFTYVLAVARLRQDAAVWHDHKPFRQMLGGNPVRIITFVEMASSIVDGTSTTLASTEIGRLIQLFKAAGYDLSKKEGVALGNT